MSCDLQYLFIICSVTVALCNYAASKKYRHFFDRKANHITYKFHFIILTFTIKSKFVIYLMGSLSNLVISIRYIQISCILPIINGDLILLTEVQTIKWQHRVPWVENLTAQTIQLTYIYGLICLPAGKFNQEF